MQEIKAIVFLQCRLALPAILACVGCIPVRSPEPPTGPHFRALTFNVNYGGPGPELAARAIEESSADVVCLQETTPAWERFLRGRLGERFPHMIFRHGGGAGGQAVLSRWPLTPRKVVPSAAGWFPGWIVTAETPVGDVDLLNVHLRPAVSARGGFSLGAYMSAGPIHVEEMKAFHRKLDLQRPTVGMGDFNEGDGGSAIGWLEDQDFTNALREFDLKSPTWEWRTRWVRVTKRLDHILYTPELYCLEARVIRRGASDHMPVLAVFERRDSCAD